jgi:H+-transporting ATPase
VLVWSAILTKILATLAAVYGWLMIPIGWHWALLIWVYAFGWFFVNDGIKLVAYRLFSASHSGLLGKLYLPDFHLHPVQSTQK